MVGEGHSSWKDVAGNPQILLRGRMPLLSHPLMLGRTEGWENQRFIPSSSPISASLYLSPFLDFFCSLLPSCSLSGTGVDHSYTSHHPHPPWEA